MFLVRSLLTPYVRQSSTAFTSAVFTKSCPVLRLAASAQRTFSTTPPNSATINQVLRVGVLRHRLLTVIDVEILGNILVPGLPESRPSSTRRFSRSRRDGPTSSQGCLPQGGHSETEEAQLWRAKGRSYSSFYRKAYNCLYTRRGTQYSTAQCRVGAWRSSPGLPRSEVSSG